MNYILILIHTLNYNHFKQDFDSYIFTFSLSFQLRKYYKYFEFDFKVHLFSLQEL
jgi:hypothetical protein